MTLKVLICRQGSGDLSAIVTVNWQLQGKSLIL
jgi:hypothetical protein